MNISIEENRQTIKLAGIIEGGCFIFAGHVYIVTDKKNNSGTDILTVNLKTGVSVYAPEHMKVTPVDVDALVSYRAP